MARPIGGTPREIPDELLEEEFRKSTPETLYKFRPWETLHNKEALTRSNIWFSSPKQLNDLRDIRLAYVFDSNEVERPEFFERLHQKFPNMTNHLPGTLAYVAALMDHYAMIKKDPQRWFQTNQKNLRGGEVYEQIGLYSTTKDALNKVMWAYYGSNHAGYCVGYDPYLIYRTRPSFCGIAHYLDEPLKFSFVDRSDNTFIDLFIKDKDWSHEDEYRFVTFVEGNKDRLVELPVEATKEVILGLNTSKEHKNEIIECLKGKYRSKVKLLKVEENIKGELTVNQVPY